MNDDFQNSTLEETVPESDWVSSPNVIQTAKSMIVGAQNNFTEVNPNYGIGLNRKAEAGATMTSAGQYYAMAYANGSSAALALDWSKSNVQTVAATGNLTITMSNPKAGGRYILTILQDESGSRTYTWPSNVKWSGGANPTGSGGSKTDVTAFVYDGTNYFGSSSLNY